MNDAERRAEILAQQEAREQATGIKAKRLKEAKAQERAKMRPPIVYLSGAEKAAINAGW